MFARTTWNPARFQSKHRQGHWWAGLLSFEKGLDQARSSSRHAGIAVRRGRRFRHRVLAFQEAMTGIQSSILMLECLRDFPA
jgi:hypothetical protein